MVTIYSRTLSLQRKICALGILPSPFSLWVARWKQRYRLARLSDDILKDIGISRAEAMVEAAKPFWKE